MPVSWIKIHSFQQRNRSKFTPALKHITSADFDLSIENFSPFPSTKTCIPLKLANSLDAFVFSRWLVFCVFFFLFSKFTWTFEFATVNRIFLVCGQNVDRKLLVYKAYFRYGTWFFFVLLRPSYPSATVWRKIDNKCDALFKLNPCIQSFSFSLVPSLLSLIHIFLPLFFVRCLNFQRAATAAVVANRWTKNFYHSLN